MENNSLQHHGVKGMKWGVRRYQSADGSLTPAGKKRYRNAVTKFTNSKMGSKYKLSDNEEEERRLVEGTPPSSKNRYKSAVTKFTNSKMGSKYKLSDDEDEERRLVEGNPPTSKRESRKKDWSEDARTASALKKKTVSEMSNAELKKLNERVRLEQEYSRLNPGTVQKGWKFVAGAAAIAGTTVGLYNNGGQLVNIGKKFLGKS